MNELLVDYQRKLSKVNEMIRELPYIDKSDKNYVRLITKANCFKNFIRELKREIKENEEVF